MPDWASTAVSHFTISELVEAALAEIVLGALGAVVSTLRVSCWVVSAAR